MAYADKQRAKAHNVFSAMRSRCNNPNNHAYPRYGGRGIKCLWPTLDSFVKDMGYAPEGLTLDRKDTNGDYCKENCRWATYTEQNSNRRDNRHVFIDGEFLTHTQAEKLLGVSRGVVAYRVKKGLPLIGGLFKNDGSGGLRHAD